MIENSQLVDHSNIKSIGGGEKVQPKMTTDASGNCGYFFSSEHVEIWGKKGAMPKELVDAFFDKMKKGYEEHLKIKEFKEKNPNSSHEDLMNFLGLPRTFSPEESEKITEESKNSIKFHKFLQSNWDSLLRCLEEDKKSGCLFNNVEGEDQFGISRQITDSMTHLNKLLEVASLKHLYDNLYEAKGEMRTSKGEGISLVFSFPANSREEAEKTLKEYKKIMIGKGLKIWMAHWGIANEYGRTEYSCPMINVMKLIAEDGRKFHFSVKEKQEHWAITKILGMTKVCREYSTRKRGTDKFSTVWYEQPLIEILGGEREADNKDKYPQLIIVRVLNPGPNMKGFVPAVLNKATYKIPSTHAMLAFAIQNRASQMNRGQKELNFNWEFLFELGNIRGTARSNLRKARADIRKKMARIKDEKIIVGWTEGSDSMQIKPVPQKQPPAKHQDDTKKNTT